MYLYDQICKLITVRLQSKLGELDPLSLRDLYISRSKKMGSDLADSQLEELWLLCMAKVLKDEYLKELIETRTQMYWAYYCGHEQTSPA